MLLVLLLSFLSAEGAKCRALAIAGGGSYGAYEAGAFQGLVNKLEAEELEYDIVEGVSAGALNSAALSQYAKGDEKQAAKDLYELWYNLDGSSSVYKEWLGGYVAGVTLHSGIYTTSPLKSLLESVVKKIRRDIIIGSTNINDGTFKTFDQSVGEKGIVDAALMSSALPSLFEFREAFGAIWIDGGVIMGNDIFTAVNACLDVTGGNQKDITIDILAVHPYNLTENSGTLNSLNILERSFSIGRYDSGLILVYEALDAFPDVFFRYYIQPSKSLPGIVAFDFSHDALMESYSIGLGDAEYLVENKIYTRDILKLAKKDPRVTIYPN